MIYHVVSIQIAPGKTVEATQWALKAAAYINQKFPTAKAHILRNINGNTGEVHYVETFESLGAWEASEKAIEADPDWLALLAAGAGLLVAGKTQHNFYQILS